MLRRKARGISEIYTGHKRREGVVKVFRCTLLVWERPTHLGTHSPFPLPPPLPRMKGGGILRVLRVLGDSMGVRSASLLILPVFFPFPRAIGRYHCQNGNGPIKILNRCYGRSFVVPYEREGEEGNDRGGGRPYSSLRVRSLDRLLIPVRTNIALLCARMVVIRDNRIHATISFHIVSQRIIRDISV